MLHVVNIFPALHGFFAQFLFKISPLFLFSFMGKISTVALFFHEKQPKKEDVPRIEKRYIL